MNVLIINTVKTIECRSNYVGLKNICAHTQTYTQIIIINAIVLPQRKNTCIFGLKTMNYTHTHTHTKWEKVHRNMPKFFKLQKKFHSFGRPKCVVVVGCDARDLLQSINFLNWIWKWKTKTAHIINHLWAFKCQKKSKEFMSCLCKF